MGKIEDETNPEKKKFKNTEKFSLSLHGVPLVDHSEVSKTSTYYIKNDSTYILEGSSKSEGIPYQIISKFKQKLNYTHIIEETKFF